MKSSIKIFSSVPKPRNPFVAFVMRRKAGLHLSKKRAAAREEKDLLQRLREAGL